MNPVRRASVSLLCAMVASIGLPAWCHAEIVETFSTAADPFPGSVYDNWSFSESYGTAKVVVTGSEGILQMQRSTTDYPPVTSAWATQTSSDLFGTTTFMERYPDGFTVTVDLGGTGGASMALHGISIGNVAALSYLGYDGFRWRDLGGSAYVGDLLALGWVPAYATTTPNQTMALRVEPSGADYTLSLTLTEGDHTFETVRTFTAAQVGALDDVGLHFRSASSAGEIGFYDNFTVVPEPGAMALLAAGVGLLLATRRRIR